jgi:hypothetical protein
MTVINLRVGVSLLEQSEVMCRGGRTPWGGERMSLLRGLLGSGEHPKRVEVVAHPKECRRLVLVKEFLCGLADERRLT